MSTVLSLARDLARPERPIAEILRHGIALRAEGNGFGVTPKTQGDLALHVGAKASEVTTIGTDAAHALSLSIEGAAPSLVEADDGAAIHRDVFPGTDAIWATTAARAELLFLLRDDRAPTSFRLHLDRGPGLVGIDRERGGLSFRDARGAVRLHIPAPVAVDARGVRRVADMQLEGDTLTVALDDAGLERPILLDPAVTQARWTVIGTREKRTFATLAWDPLRAKLIAYGGYVDASGFNYPGNPAVATQAYTFPARTFDGLADGPGGFYDAMLGGNDWQNIGYFAAFDSDRGKLVAVGATQFDCQSGCVSFNRMLVSEWDSATNTWASRCDGACAATAPGAEQRWVSAVYDVSRKYTVVCNYQSRSCSTWNGATTTGTWTPITGFPSSSMRQGFYDTGYGAATFPGGDGTYSWTGASWVKRTTSTVPANAVAYDTMRKRAIALVDNGFYSDTYEWDGTAGAWALIVAASTSTPFSKPGIAMGFDPVNGRTVAWGGGNGHTGATLSDFVSDVFEYKAYGNTCAGDVDCAGGSCRDGYCCDTQCGACQRCDGPGVGGVCATFTGAASGTEHDTCTGTKACDAVGACKSKSGQACTSANDCVTGACVDGVCCSTACNLACEVCNATPGTCTPAVKGATGRSGCGVGTCNGTLRTCSTTCATDLDCSALGYCNAGTCVATLSAGVACARDRQCTTGACRDGVCCDGGCNGPCEACTQAKGATADGVCTPLAATNKPLACGGYACSGTSGACATSCATDAECATGNYCDGAFCQKVRAQGEGCARTAQCTTGLSCADGVCCNSACEGVCQACAAANKQSGDASGVCGPAKTGSDPGNRCPDQDPSTCGTSGVCSATGTCALWNKGRACGGVACAAGVAKGQTCDGLGTCVTDAAGTACTPGLCSATTGCSFSCTADTDCDASGFCDAGTCKARATEGRTCTAANQCASGNCVDGVCCATACTGVCEACNGIGTEGTCTAATGVPRQGHGACPAKSSEDACTATACDGTTRDACKAFAGPEVSCRPASCTDGLESLAAKCDGSGKCPAPSTRSCAPFACSGTRCRDACTTDEDCTKGNHCETTTGKCASSGACDGDHSVVGADGSKTDCAPYKCDDKGCKSACASSDECASGAICDGAKCLVSTAPEDDGGGCSASPRRDASATTSLFLLLSLALWSARRRSSSEGAV